MSIFLFFYNITHRPEFDEFLLPFNSPPPTNFWIRPWSTFLWEILSDQVQCSFPSQVFKEPITKLRCNRWTPLSPTQCMKKPLKFTILSGVKYIFKLKITKQIKFKGIQSLKWDVFNELPSPTQLMKKPLIYSSQFCLV